MYCNFLLLIFYSFMLPVWYMHNPNLTSIKLDAIHVHVSVHTQGVALSLDSLVYWFIYLFSS